MEKLLVTLANKMAGFGYDVTVLIFQEDSTLESELDERIDFRQKEPNVPFGKRIPYIRYKFYDDEMWDYRVSPKQLYKYYIGNEKFDVEIAFFRGTSVKIIAGSTNKNAVHLTWVHSDFRKAGGYKRHFNNMDEVVAAYRTFDKVICVSKEAMEGFKEVIGDTGNLTKVYNMIPVKQIRQMAMTEIPKPLSPAHLNLVIVARLLDKTKGHLRLITAVSRLRQEGYDIALTVVGDGPDREMIEEYISVMNENDFVRMVGNQKNPYPYIKTADVLVCSSYFEGYNLTVAEALVLGTPVLSVKCSGPTEILENGKYGVIVENSERGLYYGIRKLYRNPELLDYYRAKAIERQSFFDEDKISRQLENLFYRDKEKNTESSN
ncbi:MAG: glycosyltransferase [Ruminococcus sp.]|nr:glycosyltransferase [Ruminococcus sp.]